MDTKPCARSALFFVLLAAMGLSGCVPIKFRNIDNVSVERFDSKPVNMTDMEHAIRLAAFQEGWDKADLAGPGDIVVTKVDEDGKRSMTVDVLFTTSQFSIHYKTSSGYHYDALNGHIDHHYLSMTDDLRDRIRDTLQEITPGA
jgi:exosome complex RNA-binding protein Csl4